MAFNTSTIWKSPAQPVLHSIGDIFVDGAPEEIFHGVSEDIIAISCVAKRLRGDNSHFSILNDTERLIKLITEEDRSQAQAIRTYFNGKLTVAQLRDEHITPFRKDLIKLLNTPMSENGEYIYSGKFAGMIYKLPYFYEYDRSLIDDIFESEYHVIFKPVRADKEGKATVSLTFIKKIDANRKRVSQTEYWFADDAGNRVVINIDYSNPLDGLFQKYIESNAVCVNGYFTPTKKDTLSFYKVRYWTPVF